MLEKYPVCVDTISAPMLGFAYKSYWQPSCGGCCGAIYGHIVARVVFLASALVTLITSVIDIAIGVFAVLLSLVTLGMVGKFNQFAKVQFAGGAYSLALFPIGCFILTINPSAEAWDPRYV